MALVGAGWSPLMCPKAHDEVSVFVAENLLREAKSRKGLPDTPVPELCLLDPDGDIVAHLRKAGRATRHPGWGCFHTEMWVFELGGREVGVVGNAVGAPFAVLIAEQMAASGCQLLVSIGSAGQIRPVAAPPYFVLVDRAWRDEGTSHHYMPPGQWCHLDVVLRERLQGAFGALSIPVLVGSSWTTDAPFRETPSAISQAEHEGILVVEMEAAALYAYGGARGRRVVCMAQVTNVLGTNSGDFDKGEGDGHDHALAVLAAIADRLLPRR